VSDIMARATAYANSFNASGGFNNPALNPQATAEASKNQRDAFAQIKQVLAQFGLPASLSDWAWTMIQNNAPANQVLLDLYERPEFKTRFPAIEARRNAGLAPIDPATYVAYEHHAQQLAKAAGLPPGFLTKEYTDRLLTADISTAELDERIKNGYQKVAEADQATRDAFRQYFGVNGDQALAAWFLDPAVAEPILEEQATMAGLAGAAHNTFGGWLDKTRVQELAKAGYDVDRAKSGFEHLAETSALYQESISETKDMTIESQGLSATFLLPGSPDPTSPSIPQHWQVDPMVTETAAEAKAAIENRRSGRTAAFKGGGGLASDKDGIALGTGD